MKGELRGICPIVATPFTVKGEVDYEDLCGLVTRLIRGGCDAVTLFGIAGEYYKLTDEERRRMAEVTVMAAKDSGGTSILSVTDHATENAVKQAKLYEDIGADCLMLLPPFFLKPGAAAIYEHMKAVSGAVSIPVMAQYAPEQTGVAIPAETFVQLERERPNVMYYKIECKPAGPYVSRLMELTQERMKIFVGNAGFQLIECMDRGAVGAMPGCSMFDVYLNIYHRYITGDRAGAIEGHNRLLPMLNHIRQNVEQIISFEKRILKRRGILKTDYCRKPSFHSDPYFDHLFDEFYREMAERYNWEKDNG